jgi:hypothetical protein
MPTQGIGALGILMASELLPATAGAQAPPLLTQWPRTTDLEVSCARERRRQTVPPMDTSGFQALGPTRKGFSL